MYTNLSGLVKKSTVQFYCTPSLINKTKAREPRCNSKLYLLSFSINYLVYKIRSIYFER